LNCFRTVFQITSGFGGEIVSTITERCFKDLECPPVRICGFDTPFPMVYEQFYIPNEYRVLQGIQDIFRKKKENKRTLESLI